MLVPLSLLHHF